uniref:Uncharacterized protein n=1 Tax=Trichogramma kaykai TaxID=54128 RepID=A0ABD2WU99_9HYME
MQEFADSYKRSLIYQSSEGDRSSDGDQAAMSALATYGRPRTSMGKCFFASRAESGFCFTPSFQPSREVYFLLFDTFFLKTLEENNEWLARSGYISLYELDETYISSTAWGFIRFGAVGTRAAETHGFITQSSPLQSSILIPRVRRAPELRWHWHGRNKKEAACKGMACVYGCTCSATSMQRASSRFAPKGNMLEPLMQPDNINVAMRIHKYTYRRARALRAQRSRYHSRTCVPLRTVASLNSFQRLVFQRSLDQYIYLELLKNGIRYIKTSYGRLSRHRWGPAFEKRRHEKSIREHELIVTAASIPAFQGPRARSGRGGSSTPGIFSIRHIEISPIRA